MDLQADQTLPTNGKNISNEEVEDLLKLITPATGTKRNISNEEMEDLLKLITPATSTKINVSS